MKLPSSSLEEAACTNEDAPLNVPGDCEYIELLDPSVQNVPACFEDQKLSSIGSHSPQMGRHGATDIVVAQNQLRDDLDQWLSEVPSVVLFCASGAETSTHKEATAALPWNDVSLYTKHRKRSSSLATRHWKHAITMLQNALDCMRFYMSLEVWCSHGGRFTIFIWREPPSCTACRVSSAVRAKISLPALASIAVGAQAC